MKSSIRSFGTPHNFLLHAVLITIIVCSGTSAVLAAPPCDPHAAQNDAARNALKHGDLDLAQRIVNQVLASPNAHDDFRANYFAGMILIRRAGNDHRKYLAAIAKLISTSDLLKKQDPVCGAKAGFFSIYTTIGAEYFNDGNIAAASRFYSLAFDNRDRLSQSYRASLFGDIGLLSYYLGNYACAYVGYQTAVSLGDSSYQARAVTMKSIVTTAGLKPACGRSDYFPPVVTDATLRNPGLHVLDSGGAKGSQTFIACEVDATSEDKQAVLGAVPRKGGAFQELITVGETLKNVCGRFSLNIDTNAIGVMIAKYNTNDLVELQIFRLAR